MAIDFGNAISVSFLETYSFFRLFFVGISWTARQISSVTSDFFFIHFVWLLNEEMCLVTEND